MSSPRCPKCGRAIRAEDVNVGTDIAFCRSCNLAHKLSTLGHEVDLEASANLDRPPDGCSYQQTTSGVVASVSARSIPQAFVLFLIAIFCNGVVSIFVTFNTVSTLNLFGVSVPEGLPAPIMNGQVMTVGMVIVMWLFLTPFILVGLALLFGFFHALVGRSELRVEGDEGVIFSGIGPVGSRQRFRPSEVTDVRYETRQWRTSRGAEQNISKIVVERSSGKALSFGSSLPEDRRKFLALATKRACRR